MVSQAHPRYAELCPGFPPPQAARVTVASGEKGLWVVWYNIGRILICVRVIIVLVAGINPVTVEL